MKFILLDNHTHGIATDRRVSRDPIHNTKVVTWVPRKTTLCGIEWPGSSILANEPPDAYLCSLCCQRFRNVLPAFVRQLPRLPVVANKRQCESLPRQMGLLGPKKR